MTTENEQLSPDDVALMAFKAGAQRTHSEEQLSRYAQMLVTLSVKLIHGLEGQKFKKDFLQAAIADKEKMTVQKVQ